MALKEKRIRRRPEDARALILDAAETRMTVDGPAGLRLQDVARAAGVSHPTILHHFGSREGLVRALNQRSLESLRNSVLARLDNAKSGDDSIKQTFAAYRDGVAQRLLWLIQSAAPETPGGLKFFDEIAEALHALRVKFASPGTVPGAANFSRTPCSASTISSKNFRPPGVSGAADWISHRMRCATPSR